MAGTPWHERMRSCASSVVGAGFAGLMAADRLRAAGHDVVVLEARDRVGGRVWSQELVPGDPRTVVERGAEFVLDGYDVMRAVLDDLRARAGRHGHVVLRAGARAASHRRRMRRWPTSRAAFAAAAAVCAAPGTSIAERGSPALRRRPGRDRRRSSPAISVTSGVDAPDLCRRRRRRTLTTAFERKPSWRVAGGNQQLAVRLARQARRRGAPGRPVRAIRHDDAAVPVRTDRRRGHWPTPSSLAVPMAVLRALDIRPGARPGTRRHGSAPAPGTTPSCTCPCSPGRPPAGRGAERARAVLDVDGHRCDRGRCSPCCTAFGGTQAGLAALAGRRGTAGVGRAGGRAAPRPDPRRRATRCSPPGTTTRGPGSPTRRDSRVAVRRDDALVAAPVRDACTSPESTPPGTGPG